MKKSNKKIIIFFILSSMLMSCNSQTFDLSIIDFDKPADSYPLQKLETYRKDEQKGHYVIKYENDGLSFHLKDDGERVTNYVFMNVTTTKQLNFNGIAIDPNFGAVFSIYENKFAFMHLAVDFKSRLKLFDFLKSKLGMPMEIVKGSTNLENIDLEMQKLFLEKLPSVTKIDKENGYFIFPEKLRWVKGDTFYTLALNPSGNSVGSDLLVITKKALKDKIIRGYQHPENDPFVNKYLLR
ncbi:hypothetical protein [Flavobacterium sp. PL002]|uniref:hypothetical protein n=1 Tax=Flavobacterium sp. PL002 TaxID=1897058 RepID=UPI00178822D8|nr:hypothetical protein [Flavobacterium sp. PL002]